MELKEFKTTMLPMRTKLLIVANRMLLQYNEDAEDAVQETYLRLWSHRSQLSDHPNPQAFAMQTLKNICIDKIRKEKNNITLDYISLAGDDKTPYHQVEEQNSAGIIKQIINTLPELQRRIIHMRDVEEYELQEIADIIGSEATAVRVNLSRARKKVRDLFLEMNKIKMLEK